MICCLELHPTSRNTGGWNKTQLRKERNSAPSTKKVRPNTCESVSSARSNVPAPIAALCLLFPILCNVDLDVSLLITPVAQWVSLSRHSRLSWTTHFGCVSHALSTSFAKAAFSVPSLQIHAPPQRLVCTLCSSCCKAFFQIWLGNRITIWYTYDILLSYEYYGSSCYHTLWLFNIAIV